jgi:lipoyl(octanoyl) transferase
MALDEALLEAAASLDRPVLRFYAWTEPAATFGYFQHYAEIARATQLRPLIRRPTGGGLVPHDADWTYSVVIPPGHPWHALNAVDSYRRMHEWIRTAFARLGVATELADCCRKSAPGQCFVGWEKFDVLWGNSEQFLNHECTRMNTNGTEPPRRLIRDDSCPFVVESASPLPARKIAGAAQRRNKLGLLIQGSVQPPPVGLERKGWEAAMVSVEAGIARIAEWKVTPGLRDRVTGLAKERYSSAAYNERR